MTALGAFFRCAVLTILCFLCIGGCSKKSAGDPKVPPTADIVFVCDVLHHVPDRRAWLQRLYGQMKTGSRLVLIEFKEGDLPEGPPATLKIPREEIIGMARDLGFVLAAEERDLLPYQVFLVFRKESA